MHDNRTIIEDAFRDWADGTGHVSRISPRGIRPRRWASPTITSSRARHSRLGYGPQHRGAGLVLDESNIRLEVLMTAGSLIRAARRSRKLTQHALGRRAQLSQSHLSLIERGHQNPSFDAVERALRATGHRLISVPTVRDDAAAVAADIRFAVADGRDDRALRRFIQLNDNLRAEHGAARFALAISTPEPTGSRQWDTALAAVVAHHLVAEHLPVPDWATAPERRLRRPWTLGEGPYTLTPSPDRIPPEFAKRRVLVDEDTLLSA